MDNSCNNSIFYNWGKSGSIEEDEHNYHLLVYHCLDVAAAGKVLLEKDTLLTEKFIRITGLNKKSVLSLVSFFLAIHDLGKFSERFQNLKPELLRTLRGHDSDKNYTLRHDSMGFHLWDRIWNKVWDKNNLRLDKIEYDVSDWALVIYPWIKAVTGHHGKPPEYSIHGVPVNPRELFTEEDTEVGYFFVETVSELFLSSDFDFTVYSDEEGDPFDNLISGFKKSSWLLAGLTVLSDWIGSNSYHFNYISEPMSLHKYWEHALIKAEQALYDFWLLPSCVSLETGIESLFTNIQTPSPLQSYVSTCDIEQNPQLFIIEETTGSGKTEAALTLAHRMMSRGLGNGVFIALPTMATSNAMYERLTGVYRKFFLPNSSPSLVLAHSSSYLSDKFRNSIGFSNTGEDSESYCNNKSIKDETISAQCSQWIADNRKKALLADVGAGTVDQAIMAVLPAYHQSLRILGLTRNVLVVDEVHAYDPYMHALLCNLLEMHSSLGGSAILLSATLPMRQRQELANSFCRGLGVGCKELKNTDYPLLTFASKTDAMETPVNIREGTDRTIGIEFFNELEAVENKIVDLSRKGSCVCWVRNTVDDAIETYQRLVAILGEEQVDLFHARFVMGNRLKIENRVMSYFGKNSTEEIRSGRVLISTQVVEQSLDLDFDYLISDLAPIDLIIQRAGRLQRHPEHGINRVPILGILAPELTENPSKNWYSDVFSRAAFVYPNHGELWLTASLLAEKGTITVPDDLRLLIEGVFSEKASENIPENLKSSAEESKGNSMASKSLANLNSLNFEAGYQKSPTQWVDEVITPTRLGRETVTLRLAKWDGKSLTPFFENGRYSWELSQVRISKNKFKTVNYCNIPELNVEKVIDSMPDKGKWSIFVPLSEVNGEWMGYATDEKGNHITLIYNQKTGLSIQKE
ncbi:CRISPR-associated helicase/endonuclease Cas3 [Methanosarcina sp. 1.H.A.2.2]|uniref:CRISPR-associated helicase/endonuclease Cas3 n=1 Tax=Methanosarcina sp. 1.H.A.2.2 TaxID=1483601 RepID=UPI0006224EEC|nr:CRISPR-associated helicase/endonuclease Cas3 [Methanosarcina sp. 1.H.A.2.2]KKH45917.1 CRISPR-associated protein Cas3 [Methanosarcina sp. 1.H.A.2.2]